jgi:hypothetical protein
MSIPPAQLNISLAASNRYAVPLPQERANNIGPAGPAPDAAQAPTAYASVSNLHKDAGFAKLFQRVNVTEVNIRNYFEERLAQANEQLAPLPDQPPADGAGEEQAQVGQQPPVEQRFTKNYADNFDFTTSEQGKLSANLKRAVEEADDGQQESFAEKAYGELRENLRTAGELADADKSGISRFLDKFKNFLNRSEKLRFEKTAQVDEAGKEVLEMKVHTSSSRLSGEGEKLDVSYKKDLKDKTLWPKVKLGLVAVGLAAVAVFVLTPAAVLAGIASLGLVGLGVGLVATPVLLKAASLIKAPWWSRTVEGQIQHRERTEAKKLGEAYATQVREQVIRDQKADANGAAEVSEDPGPSLPKALLLDKPSKASDFIKLAKEHDRDALFEQVRKELLNKQTSHLDPKTIKNATKGISGFFKDWGLTGNQKGHANKTVDIVAKEITEGIMRGVSEGVMDLAIANCTDEMTKAAMMPLWTEVKPVLDRFTEAISRLRPGNNPHGVDLEFGIHETQEPLERLQAYQDQAQELTDKIKATLKDKTSDWGANNVQAYSDGLDDLNKDIDTHLVSLQHIQKLVQGGEGLDNSISSVNTDMLPLLNENFDSAAAVEQQGQSVKNKIDALRAELDGPNKPLLVAEHGEAFSGLLDKLEQANAALVKRATALTEVRGAFDPAAITRESLQAQLNKLTELSNDHAVDVNPTNDQAIGDSLSNRQIDDLQKQGNALLEAYGYQDEIQTLQQQSIGLAQNGDFQSAVNQARMDQLQSKRELQDRRLETWARDRPNSLPVLKQESWQAQVVAARLGLEQPAPGLTPVLSKLCQPDNGAVLAELAGLAQEKKLQVLQALSQAAADGTPAAALQAYRAIGKSLDEGVELDSRKLIVSVLPNELDAVNKLAALERSADLLGSLAGTDIAKNLQRAFAKDPENIAASLVQALQASESDTVSLDSLKAIQQARGQGSLQELLDNPQAVLALGADKAGLDRLNRLLTTLLAPNLPAQGLSKAERQQAQAAAEKLQTALKPQAVIHVLAQEIGGAGAARSGDIQVQQAVQQAVQLRNPANEQEAIALNKDIQAANDLKRQVQNERKDNLEKLEENADRLLNLLGLTGKMTAEELVNKISQNKELAHELNLLFGSLTALEGQNLPEGLRRNYSADERRAGAKELGKLAPWPKGDIDLAKKADPAKAKRMEQRNDLIKNFTGEKTDQEIKRLLEKKATEARVDEYLDENLALSALMRAGSVADQDIGKFRSLIGQAGPGPQPGHSALLQKQSYLTQENARKVQNELVQGLEPRLRAVQELIQDSDAIFITSQSNYLVSQIPAHYEQISGAEEISGAFSTAASPQLSALGSKLREADTLKGLAPARADDEGGLDLTSVKTHFLKGQIDASVEALKYLRLDKFDAKRPGFFGRFMYKVLGRGNRLNRLMQSDTRKQIADLMGLATQQVKLDPVLKQQLDLVQATIEKAQKRQNDLFNDLPKAQLAFTLLAQERLAAKSEDGTAKLEGQDIEYIANQWKDLAGDVNKDRLSSVLEALKRDFMGKDTAAIEKGLSNEQFNEVAKQLGQLVAEHGEIEATHRQFRDQIVAGEIEKLPKSKDSKVAALSIKAGLDQTDVESVKSLVLKGVLQEHHLGRWATAMQIASAEPGRALALATHGKERLKQTQGEAEQALKVRIAKQGGFLEAAMVALSGSATAANQQNVNKLTEEVRRLDGELEKVSADAKKLMDKLEDRFLRQLGEQAPAGLPDPFVKPPDIKQISDGVRKLEVKVGQGQAVGPEEIKASWESLKPLMDEYSHAQLNAAKAPPSLASIAAVADLNFRLGELALKAISTVAREVRGPLEPQKIALELNNLGTEILRAAEEGTQVLEEGLGKWNCPLGSAVERNTALGQINFEGRMEQINKLLGSRFENRFVNLPKIDEDEEMGANDIAIYDEASQ